MSEKRQGFVERAERILKEINQIFLDADYWNAYVRLPGEEIIDPDPRGELKAAKASLKLFLRRAFGDCR